MNRDAREERALLTQRKWTSYQLEKLPGVASVTYGFVGEKEDRRHVSGGVPALQAGDIADGTVAPAASLRIAKHVHFENLRSWLTPGDLVVVLVGRVGDCGVVGQEQADWNATRSVGIVKFTTDGIAEGINIWLREWLKTPDASEWIDRHAPGSAHATLPVAYLKELPVRLPPLVYRRHLLDGIDAVEKRRLLNRRIVATSVELADAYFEQAAQAYADAVQRPLREVATVMSGVPSLKEDAVQGVSAALAAPMEVLRSFAPYFDSTSQTVRVPEGKVRIPGTILVAPKPGVVKTVIARIPVVPGRGMASLHAEDDADRLWLLHELRSRSRDLDAITQGAQAREISVKKLRELMVSWPEAEVRRDFAQVAAVLHDRAYTAIKENRLLDRVISIDLNTGTVGEAHEDDVPISH